MIEKRRNVITGHHFCIVFYAIIVNHLSSSSSDSATREGINITIFPTSVRKGLLTNSSPPTIWNLHEEDHNSSIQNFGLKQDLKSSLMPPVTQTNDKIFKHIARSQNNRFADLLFNSTSVTTSTYIEQQKKEMKNRDEGNTSLEAKSKKEIITIGFLPTIHGVQRRVSETSRSFLGSFEIALRDMNKNVLDGSRYQLDFIMHDNKANTEESLRGMTELYNKGCLAFMGPEGLCAVEARLAGAWNVPMFSFRCRESTVSNKDGLYPTFVRTIPSTSKVSKSLISIMKHFKWTIFQALVEDNPIWIEAASTLRQLSEVHNIRMNPDAIIKASADFPMKEMSNILDHTYENTRIYVVLGDYDIVVHFVNEMHKKGLDTGEYVVIAVIEEPYDPEQSKKFFRASLHDREEGQMTVPIIKYLLILLPSTPSNPNYKSFLYNSKVISYNSPYNFPRPLYPDLNIKVPIFAAYLYDAVSLYARALKEVGEEGLDPRNGTLVVSKITKRTYKSIQGNTMFIDAHGNAEANYTLLAVLPNGNDEDYIRDDRENYSGDGDDDDPSYKVQIVGHFLTHEVMLPSFTPVADMPWVGGRVPLSEPECGFDGNKCQIQSYWLVAIVCIAATCITIAVIFACRHYIYEQKLASLMWKIEYKDLFVADHESDYFTEKVVKLPFGILTTQSSENNESDLHSKFRIVQYKKQTVAIKIFPRKHVEINREVKEELYEMKELSNDNINRFIGACVEPTFFVVVMHYCSRGSLKDILDNEAIHLDDMLISSLVFDLIKGMIYLHDSSMICHGRLKPSNCLVDSRWVLQVSDFGLNVFRDELYSMKALDNKTVSKMLWQAPEILKSGKMFRGTQKGDVYSFALVLYEIFARKQPWSHVSGSDIDILYAILNPNGDNYLRPDVSVMTCSEFVIRCMVDCWNEDENIRPDFKNIKNRLKPMLAGLSANIFDNMLAIMEKYAKRLEFLVEERTMQLAEEKRKLAEEKKKTETLLLSMLPVSVAEQLIKGSVVIPEQYECVTIYFSDIVSFTTLSAQSTPMQIVDMLNDLYTLFDSIIGNYDVYKVETIGDAYMVVSGLPIRNADRHAGEIASMSLCLLDAITSFQIRHKPGQSLKLRIGIHSGPVVAGVVGRKMPRYCLFGDTVNTASRLETTGEAMKIHCSSDCRAILDKLGGYRLELRGVTSLKGRGEMVTYFVAGEEPTNKGRRLATKNLSTSALFPSFRLTQRIDGVSNENFHQETRSVLATPNNFPRHISSTNYTKAPTPRSPARKKFLGMPSTNYPDNFDPVKRRYSARETERKSPLKTFSKLETHVSVGSLDYISNDGSERVDVESSLQGSKHFDNQALQKSESYFCRQNTPKHEAIDFMNNISKSHGLSSFSQQHNARSSRQSTIDDVSLGKSNPISGFFGSLYNFMKGCKLPNVDDERKATHRKHSFKNEFYRNSKSPVVDKEYGIEVSMKRKTSRSCDPLLGIGENQPGSSSGENHLHNQRSNSFSGRNTADVFYVFNFNINPLLNLNHSNILTSAVTDESQSSKKRLKHKDLRKSENNDYLDLEVDNHIMGVRENSLTESAMFEVNSCDSEDEFKNSDENFEKARDPGELAIGSLVFQMSSNERDKKLDKNVDSTEIGEEVSLLKTNKLYQAKQDSRKRSKGKIKAIIEECDSSKTEISSTKITSNKVAMNRDLNNNDELTDS